MNHEDNDVISIKILDRTYKIKCTPSEAHDLQNSARYLDEQMRKVRQGGMVTNTDRVAVVTALNICHELLELRKKQNQNIELVNQRIHDLHDRVKKTLEPVDICLPEAKKVEI